MNKQLMYVFILIFPLLFFSLTTYAQENQQKKEETTKEETIKEGTEPLIVHDIKKIKKMLLVDPDIFTVTPLSCYTLCAAPGHCCSGRTPCLCGTQESSRGTGERCDLPNNQRGISCECCSR